MDDKKRRQVAKMYDKYADDIYKYLYSYGRDKELAEDLLADTFVRVIKNIDKFDFNQPRAWLYTIARNLLRDHWKKKSTVTLNEKIEVVDNSDSIEEKIDKQLSKERLENAIKKLPSREADVIRLRFVRNFSAKEVGKIVNISPENVRIIQYRALKRLKGAI